MKTNAKLLMLTIVAASLLLGTCSGGSAGGDTATIVISMSSGSAASKSTIGIEQLKHIITLTGPTGKQTLTISGGGTAKATVFPGHWFIDVEGYYGEELYSVGATSADVKAGRSTNVSIEMTVVWAGPGGSTGSAGTPQHNVANTIKFMDTQAAIVKTYGDPKFTNAVNPAHSGSGAITYTSSDPTVATVDANTGEVTILKVGSTDITAKKAADPLYAQTQVQYSLVINKALLTVKADNINISTLDSLPALTFSYSPPLYYSDVWGTDVTGSPNVTCTDYQGPGNGSYPGVITIAQGTLAADNYDFDMVDGTLSVALASQPTLAITNPGTKTYGDANFTLAYTGGSGAGAVSFAVVNGDAISLSGTTATIAKAGPVDVKLTKDGDLTYSSAEATITINVGKRDLSSATVTVAVSGQVAYNGNAQIVEVGGLSLSVNDTSMVTGSINSPLDYTVSPTTGYSNNTYPNGTNGSSVTITATSTGNFTGSKTGTFTIDPKALTVATVATTKVYDGFDTIQGGITITLGGIISPDNVSPDMVTLAAAYTSPNVVASPTVRISTLDLTGAQSSYYTVAATSLSPNSVSVNAGTTRGITALSVGVVVTVNNKQYNGSTAATVNTVTFTPPILSGDTVNLTGGTATFANANVGTNINVSFSGWTLSGASSGNYSLSGQPPTTTANITLGTGATLSAPSVSGTPTLNSITLNTIPTPTTGQTVIYGYSTTPGGTMTTGGPTFNGLTAGTTYYFYAYADANANYGQGQIAGPTPISTASATNYTVTYNLNGGGGTQPTQDSGTAGSGITLPGGTGITNKPNFVFNGWNTQSDGSGTHYNASASYTIGSSNVTLYVDWDFQYAIGANVGGAIVYYRDKAGFTLTDYYSTSTTCNYLAVTPSSSLLNGAWASFSYLNSSIGGTLPNIGAGKENTQRILATDNSGIADYVPSTYGSGYFVPSTQELVKLAEALNDPANNTTLGAIKSNISVLLFDGFWSSTEVSSNQAEFVFLKGGSIATPGTDTKSTYNMGMIGVQAF